MAVACFGRSLQLSKGDEHTGRCRYSRGGGVGREGDIYQGGGGGGGSNVSCRYAPTSSIKYATTLQTALDMIWWLFREAGYERGSTFRPDNGRGSLL